MIRIAKHERVCSQCSNDAEPGSLLCETCEAVEVLERESGELRASLAAAKAQGDEDYAMMLGQRNAAVKDANEAARQLVELRASLADLDARLARVAQAMGENAPAIARLILVDAALDGWEPAK